MEKVGTTRYGWLLSSAKWLIPAGFIMLAYVLYQSGTLNFFMSREKILDFLDSLGPFGFVGFVLLQATQVVLAPIPGEVTGLIGGFAFGPWGGIALSTLGLVLGSIIAFSVARACGRPIVEKVVDGRILKKFDYLLHHKGIFLIFLLFLMPGFPKDYLCFILGLGQLSTREFIVVSSVGRLFGTILLSLGGGYIRYQQYGRFFILLGVALVVTLGALIFKKQIEALLSMLRTKECPALEVTREVRAVR